ncbi:MAG: riboflavin biosynthesis protein RibF [Enterobacteriaceae bacterium]
MEIFRGISNIKFKYKKCAITVGNFDGFHLGHRYLINNLISYSKFKKIPSIVVIFEPQPKEYFFLDKAPPRISNLRDKLYFFSKLNIDCIICIKFNKNFAEMTFYEFIHIFLYEKLNINSIFVGNNFCFGKDKIGNVNILKKFGKKLNFDVFSFDIKKKYNYVISSTFLRNKLEEGMFREAYKIMGHPYQISGRVAYGNSLGKKIGFPTININLFKKIPISGVYCSLIFFNNIFLEGVSNVGIKPTFGLNKKKVLETHLFNFKCKLDLYKKHVIIIILEKIRKEIKFNSVFELIKQIEKDIVYSKLYFKNNSFFVKILKKRFHNDKYI